MNFTRETRQFRFEVFRPTPARDGASAAFDARSLYVNSVLVGCKVYCVGALEHFNSASVCLWIMDLNTKTFTTCPSDAEVGKPGGGVCLCVYGDSLFTFGGEDPAHFRGENSTYLRKYDMVLGEWTLVDAKSPPRARAMCSGELIDEARFVLFGGYDLAAQLFLNETWVFDVRASVWSQVDVQGQAPCPRWTHESCASEDSGRDVQDVFIYGGYGGAGLLADLFILHCRRTGYRWSRPKVSGVIPPAMNGNRMTYFGGKILLSGGSGNGNGQHFLSIFDVQQKRWYEVHHYLGRAISYAADSYVVHGHGCVRDGISEHAAVACHEGVFLVFGSVGEGVMLKPE